jgi:predicted lipoprotein with Yx(FWY)xxD motif
VSGRAAALLAAVVLGALALAGCGGGSSSTAADSSAKSTTTSLPPVAEPPPNAEEGTVFVSLGSAAGLGEILVDSEGHTLYTFSNTSGEEPGCSGPCEKAWQPLLVPQGKPEPSNGTSAALLGTVEQGGQMQATYAEQPLFTFSGDKQPGEANGQGTHAFGLDWTALKASGDPAG